MLKINKIILLFICICFLGIAYSGCSKEENEVKADEKKASEEPPSKMSDIEENIDKVIISLGGPKEEDKKEELQEKLEKSKGEEDKKEEEKSKEGDKQQEDKKADDSSKDQQDSNQDSEQSGEEKSDQEKKIDQEKKVAQKLQIISPAIWNEISSTLEDIHFNWNELVVELREKVQDKSQLEDFSNSLNTLTNSAKANDQMKSLAQANYLYSYIPEFLSFYKGSIKASEVKRMKYYARNSIIMAREPNWPSAVADIDKLLEIFDTYVLISKESEDSDKSEDKEDSKKVEQETLMKLKLSFNELETVIKEYNKELVEVKGKVVLTNIDEYQKYLEQQKEKEKEKEKK